MPIAFNRKVSPQDRPADNDGDDDGDDDGYSMIFIYIDGWLNTKAILVPVG